MEVLPSVDAEGRAQPGSFGREAVGQGLADGGRKPKKLQRYTEGEKQVYFADDNQKSLDDLVREQRHGGGRHMDENLAENISRKTNFRYGPSKSMHTGLPSPFRIFIPAYQPVQFCVINPFWHSCLDQVRSQH